MLQATHQATIEAALETDEQHNDVQSTSTLTSSKSRKREREKIDLSYYFAKTKQTNSILLPMDDAHLQTRDCNVVGANTPLVRPSSKRTFGHRADITSKDSLPTYTTN
jgi:hypothetical protein